MKKLVLGLLTALVLSTSFADYLASNGKDMILLREEACPASIKELAVKQGLPAEVKLFAGESTIEGKKVALCWTPYQDQVFIIDADGDAGFVPQAVFRKIRSV